MARHDFTFEWVAVHDGARPLVSSGLISRGLAAAREMGAAIAALPATDTIKVTDGEGVITDTPERSNIWLAQTPQVFRTDLLVGAYDSLTSGGADVEATDCARMLELTGHPVKVFEGEHTNIKITMDLDLVLAEALVRSAGGYIGGGSSGGSAQIAWDRQQSSLNQDL
jgi:2-C-methyl-D-erythritol 4-phosphate cytidylyltransferase